MTGVGVLLGTAAYMSPEQARGKTVDKRADIWAFGCVLYEMLTGTQPFHGSDLTETLASIVKDQPDLSKVPVQVRRLLARCLEKDPSRRLRDLGDAWDLLDDRAQPPAVAVAPVRARWPLALGVGVAVAALAFAAAWRIASRPAAAPSDVQRLTVALPENAGNLHSLAISPDGRYLAIAVDVAGTRRLWLRRLDSFQAQPVPASDGAMFPFWSPDSRFVAFFASGKLKQAAVAGGPPVAICDAPDGRGGSWNRDGVIVFSPGPSLAIQRVSATGGSPIDVSKPAGTLRFPTFLPDGRHFLYLNTQAPADQSGIRLASLDGKEDVRLLSDLSTFSIAAGRLVFVRSGTLIAQPIDPGTGRLAGDAVPIVDGVPFANVNNYAPVTISASGVLVYAGADQGNLAVKQLTWFDREGKRLGPVGVAGPVRDPALSPDGRTVVFSRVSTSGSGLWLRALDREVEQQFTAVSDVPTAEAIWSPDAGRIVFRSGSDLLQKRADGSGVVQPLAEGSQFSTPTDWSRDGQYLVFTHQDAKTLLDVWFLPLNSSERKPVPFLQSAANEHWARLSPDGRWMAYVSDGAGRDEVYVRPFPSGDGQWQISSAGGTEPRWRRDGKELFFIAADGSMMAAAVASETTGTRLVFLPGASQPLFDTHSQPINTLAWRYDVTPDGKRFLLALPVGASAGPPPLNVVVNWDAALTK
jgi:eukaryotic-like serine/threonine-protein kinase